MNIHTPTPLAFLRVALFAGLFGSLPLSFAAVAAAAEGELTLEEVVARHTEARGGAERWQQVEGLRSAGKFTGFSLTQDFVRYQTQDGRYHLDHLLGDQRVVIGYDGEQAWWINGWYGIDWPIALAASDRVVLWQDAEMATPLMDFAAKGHQLTLTGLTELDGQPVLELELQRAQGDSETWYLDPETYLELARDSGATDFGRLSKQRTFFDDFRTVGGLVIPHYIESEFGTRHRVMEVQKVEVLTEVDPSIFAKPLPGQLAEMGAHLEGDWQVTVESRPAPQAPWIESKGESTFELAAGGGLLRESLRYADSGGAPVEIHRNFTYDRLRERYQLTEVDGDLLRTELFDGNHEENVLILDNLATGTAAEIAGSLRHQRRSCKMTEGEVLTCEHQSSTDAGETWTTGTKLTYRRADS